MQKVIVTGGCGFIGSHLVDYLINKEIEVHIIDKNPTNINPKAILHPFDISKPLGIYENIFNKTDVVFHLAAETSVQESIENPHLYHDTNVNGTLNMLFWASKAKVKKFIFSSSSAVYGEPHYTPIDENHPKNPLSPYALSKSIGEQYCALYSKLYNLNTICLRYFNAYGDRMKDHGAYRSVISIFKEQLNNNKPLNIVNDGEQKRDFVHVDDIVQANILSIFSNINHAIFNVGTEKGYSVNEIANMFGVEKKYGETRIEPRFSISDSTLIRNKLEWTPKGNLDIFINKIK